MNSHGALFLGRDFSQSCCRYCMTKPVHAVQLAVCTRMSVITIDNERDVIRSWSNSSSPNPRRLAVHMHDSIMAREGQTQGKRCSRCPGRLCVHFAATRRHFNFHPRIFARHTVPRCTAQHAERNGCLVYLLSTAFFFF